MFKKFVSPLLITLSVFLSMNFEARAQLEIPQPSEKKGMQSKSFGSKDELEKLREMVKQNRPGTKEEKEAAPPSENNSQPSSTPEEEQKQPPTTEEEVWQKYKSIETKQKDGEKADADPSEKEEENNAKAEDTDADEETESADALNNLLRQYKSDNGSGLTSRSFGTPEDAEKARLKGTKKEESSKAETESPKEKALQKIKTQMNKKSKKSANKENDKEKLYNE